jgi:predicted nucleic acid-binding protein
VTLALDPSALVKRYVVEEERELVLEQMERHSDWAASAVCLAETRIAFCRRAPDEPTEKQLADAFLEDWEEFHVVPVDDACLARAVEIGCEHGIRTLDAVHLAAAERLPRPVSFLTFDDRQASAARGLGFTDPRSGEPSA